jgi:peptide/nickel transport system substrate-binding protein
MRSPLRRPRLLRAAAITAAATVAMSLAACAPGSEEPGAPESAEMTLAMTGIPPSLDPAQLDLGASTYVWGSVFDTLLYLDNSGEIQPNAAESWEYSDDALTLTFTLREGMTFSTGDPVDAEAVKATLERTQATPGARSGDLAQVESIEAPDDRTVVLHLSAPAPALLTNLSSGTGVIGDPATLDTERTALDPVGSGPYVLDTDASVTGSSYVLTRRDDYWNAEAYPFATITVRVIADAQAQLNALLAGEIDAAGISGDQIASVEGAGLTTTFVDAMGVGSVLLLDRDGEVLPALADVRVRKAINMAFDREGYLEALLGGGGRVTNQFFNPYAGGYNEEVEDYYEFDVEAARDLMAEAGYEDGFHVAMPSTFLSTTFEPSITQSLADIGITVEWEPVPPQEVASSLFTKKYPMAFFIDGLNAPGRELDNNFGPTGFLNPFGYQDPELTALMDEVAVTTDADEANSLYQEISAYTVENALNAPILYFGTYWATHPGVTYLPEGYAVLSIRNFGSGN